MTFFCVVEYLDNGEDGLAFVCVHGPFDSRFAANARVMAINENAMFLRHFDILEMQ